MRPKIEIDGAAVAAVRVRIRAGLNAATTATIELGASPEEAPNEMDVRIGDCAWRLVGHPDPTVACDLDPDGGPGQVVGVDPATAAPPVPAGIHGRGQDEITGIEVLEDLLGQVVGNADLRDRKARTIAVRGPVDRVLTTFCAETGMAWWHGADGIVVDRPGAGSVRLQPAMSRRLAKGFHRLTLHDGPVPRPGETASFRDGEGIVHAIDCEWRIDGTMHCEVLLGPWEPAVAAPRHDFLAYPCSFAGTDPVEVSPQGLACKRPVAAELRGLKGAQHRLGLPVAAGDSGILWVPNGPYSERVPFVVPLAPDQPAAHVIFEGDCIELAPKRVLLRGDELAVEIQRQVFRAKNMRFHGNRFDFDSP